MFIIFLCMHGFAALKFEIHWFDFTNISVKSCSALCDIYHENIMSTAQIQGTQCRVRNFDLLICKNTPQKICCSLTLTAINH